MKQSAITVLGTFILLSPFLGGCIVTGTMWHKANESSYKYPEIVGVIRPGSVGMPARNIVVRYQLNNDDWRLQYYAFVYVLIPVASDAKPVQPFRYDGDLQASDAIVKSLTVSRANALHATALRFACPPGRMAHTVPGYVPVDPSMPDGSPLGAGGYGPKYDIIAMRIQLSSDGSVRDAWVRDDEPTLSGTVAILVPFSLARPADDIRSAKTVAAMLTPVTLLADVVVTPVVFGSYILRGGG